MAQTAPKQVPLKKIMRSVARLVGTIDVCVECRPKIAEFCFDTGYRAKTGRNGLKGMLGPTDLCFEDNLKVLVIISTTRQAIMAIPLPQKDDIDIPESVIDD